MGRRPPVSRMPALPGGHRFRSTRGRNVSLVRNPVRVSARWLATAGSTPGGGHGASPAAGRHRRPTPSSRSRPRSPGRTPRGRDALRASDHRRSLRRRTGRAAYRPPGRALPGPVEVISAFAEAHGSQDEVFHPVMAAVRRAIVSMLRMRVGATAKMQKPRASAADQRVLSVAGSGTPSASHPIDRVGRLFDAGLPAREVEVKDSAVIAVAVHLHRVAPLPVPACPQAWIFAPRYRAGACRSLSPRPHAES